jgi:hypothetical protein
MRLPPPARFLFQDIPKFVHSRGITNSLSLRTEAGWIAIAVVAVKGDALDDAGDFLGRVRALWGGRNLELPPTLAEFILRP